MLKGVLFDMDGVLVDSEKFICEAAIEMFRQIGLVVRAEDFIPFVGSGEESYLGGVAEKYNFPVNIKEIKKLTYEIYEVMVEGKLTPLPGVNDFIMKAKKKDLKLAVATSADKIKMEINLRNIGIPEDTFLATVNGLEVKRKKPFPDIFERAAEKMNLHPGECLVVEDAINGVQAAQAAGAKCLALTTSFSKEELALADWVSGTLADAPEEVLSW